MALSAGTRLGPYEIQTPLGAGGMGEVYRARDTRLERTVAIKILPSHLDLARDGRVLANSTLGEDTRNINMVVNWTAGIRK